MAIRQWQWTNVALVWSAGVSAVGCVLLLADALSIPKPLLGQSPTVEGIIVVAVLIGIVVGVISITGYWLYWLGSQQASEYLGALVVVVSVFIVALLIAQSNLLGLDESDSWIFGVATTVVARFLYRRFSKRV